MIDRRTLFGATAAVTSAIAGIFGSRRAVAESAPMHISFEGDVEPRGTDQRLERLPKLDLESYDDFLTALRVWSGRSMNSPAKARFDDILTNEGLDPEEDMPLEKFIHLVEDDTVVGISGRVRTSGQQLMWKALQLEFHGEADKYFAEMEATDNAGPGTLELNPDMDVPKYCRYEIHIQPGGYVGDPFAGHIYHYGTNNFYMGANYQDEIHKSLARQMATPEDGKVLRILDLGCGTGQLTAALKERFPEAEVWGIDIGAPMIRYAHMRAVDLGIETHFAQRLAEDTKFPDNHFDIVTSYLLHHEVTAEASVKIIEEAHRVLRPGGVFFPIDFLTGAGATRPDTAYTRFAKWRDHRWNEEVWRMEYDTVDFFGAMEKAGFDVNKEGPPAWRSRYNVLGTKRA